MIIPTTISLDDRQILSDDLKVAIHIYKSNEIGFSKLVDDLKSIISKNQISHSIDTLSDWGVVKGHYGKVRSGVYGRLFTVTDFAKPIIQQLIDQHNREEELPDPI